MSRNVLTGTGIGVALLLFFAVNVFSNVVFKTARIDLTEEKLYTLSQGSRSILERLEEPIHLRLYYSKKLGTGLPVISTYAQRVQELLEEYVQAAKGKLTLDVIDPEPFSEAEDRAVGYGLQGVPLENSNNLFYFGLAATSSTDDQEIIPFFQLEREEFLEYDITRLVYQLTHPKQKIVGLLTALPMDGRSAMPFMPGGEGQPWMIMDQIRQVLTVRTLQSNLTKIPDDIDVLMLVHPKELNDTAQYAIDQFILGGGRAVIFVDPHAEADSGGANPMNPMMGSGPKHSDLRRLFEAWGIELVSGKVVGDLPIAKKVNFRQQNRMAVAEYPVWIDLTPDHMNQEDIVTSKLPTLTMASPGAIKKKENSSVELIPLLQTDLQAMLIDAARLQFLPDVEGLLNSYVPAHEQYTLAARITGTVKTAFPDGKPADSGDKKADDGGDSIDSGSPHLMESKEPINVIVVADTDLLQDRFWVQIQSFLGQRLGIPTAANHSFVINALDNLTGSNDLISVRNRGSFSRPFTLVREIQLEAEQQFRQKEQALQERLRATERKIQELQSQKKDQTTLILSQAQQEEIDRFRKELLATRKELRGVQHELQKHIEGLEVMVKFFNIGFIPLVITVGGAIISLHRIRWRGVRVA